MEFNIFDVLINIFSELVYLPLSLLLGLIGFKLKNMISRSNYIKKLRLNSDLNKMRCITANPEVDDEGECVTLGYVFEYMSVGELQSTWSKCFSDLEFNVTMSSKENTVIPPENLLVIGGPFHNQITRLILEQFDFPFGWDSDANLTFKTETGVDTYSPKLTGFTKQFYGEDYSLVLNIKNPTSPDKRILLIIGCRSIGCLGGAIFLSKHMNKIKRKGLTDEYAFVVKVSGNEEQLTSDPRLEKVYSLDTQSIKKNI
ncbi:MAG: hypothetical protein IJY57_03125 [Clostridia bacterium]|nr:hypothetical protein [Clostridia bacterium]